MVSSVRLAHGQELIKLLTRKKCEKPLPYALVKVKEEPGTKRVVADSDPNVGSCSGTAKKPKVKNGKDNDEKDIQMNHWYTCNNLAETTRQLKRSEAEKAILQRKIRC
jgi:hypothetical protein